MSKKERDPKMEKDAPRFEDALKRLEEIVARLEQGELALEDSLGLYEEGVQLSRYCHAKLEEAEGKIEMLLKDAKGEAVLDASGRPKTAAMADKIEDEIPF
jgi:exodeoxyribonuclease VII small subunit